MVKKPIYKKWWFWVIVVIIVGGIASTRGNNESKSTSNEAVQQDVQDNSAEVKEETPTEAVTEAPAISVSAKDIISAYESNEVSADKQYKNQKLAVTGVVDKISIVLDQTTVTLTNGEQYAFTGVRCYFDDEAEVEKVSNLAKGDTITIEGICDGYDIEPNMKNCIIK